MSKKKLSREELRAKLKAQGERWDAFHDEFDEFGQYLVGPANTQPYPQRDSPEHANGQAAPDGSLKERNGAQIKKAKAKRKK